MKFLVLISLIGRWSVSRWLMHLVGSRLVGGWWSVDRLVGGRWQVVDWLVVLRKPHKDTTSDQGKILMFQQDI